MQHNMNFGNEFFSLIGQMDLSQGMGIFYQIISLTEENLGSNLNKAITLHCSYAVDHRLTSLR